MLYVTMKNVLFKTFLGLVLCIGGICVSYLYLDGLKDGNNLLLLAAAIVLIAVGVFCLVKAGKSDATVITKLKNEPHEIQKRGPNMLEKNNELVGDYQKTANERDRLKVLEAAQESNVI
jgi:hypothetical protein